MGDLPEREMFNVFNMGVGMIAIVAKEDADKALTVLRENGKMPMCSAASFSHRRRSNFMLKAKIAVLVSGGGTNLQALLDAQDSARFQR
jgi:hypothetical protein